MMTIMADENFGGQLDRICDVLLSQEWTELWDLLEVRRVTFNEVLLLPATVDSVVWETCQRERIVLITGNRNEDRADSLNAALLRAAADSLPVITVGDPNRVNTDGRYARACAEGLINRLSRLKYDPQTTLGSGRLYIPIDPV